MFLGSDRNKSQYFFFLGQPNRIYVRYHNFLLDEACDSKIYEGKEKIVELLKCLNTKGINEKHLHESINSLLKQDTIRNLTVEEKNEEEGSMIFESSKGYCIFGDEQYRTKIIEDILDIEERFSNYLAMKSCQWASPPKR